MNLLEISSKSDNDSINVSNDEDIRSVDSFFEGKY
jgi:hypothetical protein